LVVLKSTITAGDINLEKGAGLKGELTWQLPINKNLKKRK
jgi:hypothetical protein